MTTGSEKWRWMSLPGCGCETGMVNQAHPCWLPAAEEIDSPLHAHSQIYSHRKVTGRWGRQVALSGWWIMFALHVCVSVCGCCMHGPFAACLHAHTLTVPSLTGELSGYGPYGVSCLICVATMSAHKANSDSIMSSVQDESTPSSGFSSVSARCFPDAC